MRKLISFVLLVLFTSLLISTLAFGQTEEENKASPLGESTESAEIAESDYDLPYPGMLPDHPLYKLKVLRDKILLFLTRDPFKKAQRHLQMADKEFMMALKLAEKDKMPLAQHTAFKAEHHMTLLNTELRRHAYSGKGLNQSFIDRAHKAVQKHQEVLKGMMARANEQEKESLSTIYDFSLRNDQALSDLEEEQKEMEEEIGE